MPDLDEWLAVLHVVGGAVWLGSWAAICVFASTAVRNPSLDALRRLYAAMRTLGPVVIGPSTLLVLAAGIALVARAPWVGFGDPWIVIGFVTYALVTLVGILGMGSTAKKASPALEANDVTTAVDLTSTWLRYAFVVTAVLLIATVDMVVKP